MISETKKKPAVPVPFLLSCQKVNSEGIYLFYTVISKLAPIWGLTDNSIAAASIIPTI